MSGEPIRPGYKRTEVGEIPEDWQTVPFGIYIDSAKNGYGRRPRPGETGPAVLRLADVAKGYIDLSDARPVAMLPVEFEQYRIQRNDLLFIRVNGNRDYVGRCILVETDYGDVAVNDHFIRVKLKNNLDAEFAKYLFRDNQVRSRMLAAIPLALGGQLTINQPTLENTVILVPAVDEQRAIAEALSDVDVLLDALDRLIAKKRMIKQGAMQALLTGRVRLPGFSGEWVNKQLSNLADIRSGGTPSTTQPKFWDGSMPWCTPTDITALQGTKYLTETRRTITVEGLENSSAEIIPARSIVMTSRATIGECAINLIPVSTNQGFKNFVPFEAVDVEFLYYLLTTKKQRFISLCGGSTFLEIGKAQLATFEVILPATTAEQRAIAEILSDMDAEIDALEKRRAKLRAMKQGMMQELLTGRIRLVQPQKQAQEAHV